MSKEKKTDTKNAEFIELDKTQFKKFRWYLNKWFLLFTAIVLVILFILYDKTIKLPSFQNNHFSVNKKQKENYVYDSEKSNKLSKNELILEENLALSDEFSDKELNQNNMDSLIYRLDQFEKNYSLLIKENINQINELKNQIEKLNQKLQKSTLQENSNNESSLSYNKKNNIPYIVFLNFKKNLLNGSSVKQELIFLKTNYQNNDEINSLLNFFSALEDYKIVNYNFLLRDINLILENLSLLRNNKEKFYETDFSSSENKINYDIFSSKDNFLNYFRDLFRTNFKIKKVSDEKGLSDYGDNDFDGLSDFRNKINNAKEYIISRDLESAILQIQEINSPISKELENWFESLKELRNIEVKLLNLEDKIFKDLTNIEVND